MHIIDQHLMDPITAHFYAKVHPGFEIRSQFCSVALVRHLLDQPDVNDIVLVGHSLGGAVAHVVSYHCHSLLPAEYKSRIRSIGIGAPLWRNKQMRATSESELS